MYNKYLNYIVKSFESSPDDYTYTTTGVTDIFDPNALVGDANYTRLYDNVIFYHVLEFGKYNVLPNLIGVPTQQYFDKVLSDGYKDSSGSTAYTLLDGYKIYSQYIVDLSQTFQLLDSTSNLILVQQNLLENVLWNIRRNYQQMINILNFLSFGNFNDDNHYRLGYYKKYSQFGTLIVGNNSVFNSLSESKIPELNDNVFSVLKLSQLSGEPLTTISQFYTNEIVKQLRASVVSIQDAIETAVYEDYFNNYNLWKRVVIDNSPMKNILDNSTTILYNQPVNFYSYFASLGDSGKKRMSVMNYIPLLAIRDIPTMMYDLLNETTLNLSDGGIHTAAKLTIFLRDYMDYRDRDQREVAPEIADTAVDDFKQDIYSDILEAVIFYYTDPAYTLIDETYLRTVSATYASTSSEYVTIPIFRPESVMTVGDFVDVLPIKAIVERFRTEFKSKINTFISTYSITNTDNVAYDLIANMIDNIVNSFIKDTIPSHSTYVSNGYSFYNIDATITSSTITEPRYCDAISSIWYKINKKMIRTYNDLFNNYLLSRSYYTDNLGPTMVENFMKFKTLVTEAPYSIEYYNTTNPYTSDIYNSTEQPVSGEGFNFYLLRPTDDEPYATTKINVTHMITHFEKDYAQYNTLKTILNIKNMTINRRLYQYSDVRTIASNITSTMRPYATSYRAISILNTTEDDIIQDYKGVMDIIGGVYSDILEKSIKGIMNLGMSGSNPYTSSKNVTSSLSSVNRLSYLSSWWNTFKPIHPTYFTGSPNLYDLLTGILDSVDAIILFTDRNVKTLYNNYGTRLDVLNYVINKVVSSTDINFIINSLDITTLATVKNSLRTYIIKNINTNNTVIENIAVIGTTTINTEDGYTYPIYSYDNPNIPNDDGGKFNITYDNSELDVAIMKYVNNEQPSFAWAKELGHRIIDKVTLEVDGIVYDEYTSELLHLDHQLRGDSNQDRGYNIMIGNTEDMYTISSNRKNSTRLYVPLNFWFCKDIGNSLPMINILYSDIILHIVTKPIEELFYRDVGSRFIKKPKLGAHLITRYIYLDDDERQKIAKSKMEFLIERYRYGGKHTYEFKDFSGNVLTSRLFFHDPCKYLIWTSKLKSKTTSAKDKIDWTYYGYRTRDNDGRLTIKKPSVDKTKIQFNGRDRETYKTTEYYNAVQPYSKHTSSLDFGENMYSFATLPLLLQPSGSANLTHIAELAILNTYKDNTLTRIEEDDLIMEYEYWARTYQVIRIMSGIMAPAFIY
jgi:hypothetical protein